MAKSAPKAVREKALAEISSAMRRHGGEVLATAEFLGIGRATLHRWMRQHALLRKALEVARQRRAK